MFDALAATLSNMAPVEGIFIVLTIVAASMGSLTPWAFVVASFAILATGWNVAQLAQRIPSAGSYVGFSYHGFNAVRPGWGRHGAAFVFYLSLLSGPITIAAVIVFLGSWLQTAAGLPNVWWLIITLLLIAGSLPILLRGVVASARTAILLFCLEAGGLMVISLVILAQSGSSLSAPLHANGGHPGGFSGLLGITFAVAVSGLVGWECSAGLAEEIRNPRRVIPVAVLTSITVVGLLYLIATWSAVAGYVNWLGVARGTARLGDVTNAAPFLELADHYARWFHWGVVAIGVISPAACYIAAMTACSRWTFASARGGLLPAALAKVSPSTQVPAASVLLWTALVAALCIVPYFLLNGNAVLVAAYEAGIGTVPLLFIYLLVSILTPIYIGRRDRTGFRIPAHVLPAVVAVGVIGYGVYEFVQPNQPEPANRFWVFILAIAVLAALGAITVVRRRGDAIDRLGRTAPAYEEDLAPHNV